jgi:hypothetical protein
VDIKKPTGDATTTWCYHYDHQVVTPTSPRAYDLDTTGIEGDITPDHSPITYKWTLDATAGTLQNDTSKTPTHTSPTVSGEGTLTLQAYATDVGTGSIDKRDVKVFKDHLDRDIANFDGKKSGTLGGFNMTPPTPGVHVSWVCHQSASHAYDGVVRDDEWFPVAGFAQEGETRYTDAAGNWTLPAATTLKRYDVVAYYGTYGDPDSTELRHSHILLDSINTWAANNESIYPHADQGQFVIRNWDHYSKNRTVKVRYIKIWRK